MRTLLTPYTGSSPLARGTLVELAALFGLQRFIPAGAGNTIHFTINNSKVTVHPRWRGEHRSRGHVDGGVLGSSPLARGTP